MAIRLRSSNCIDDQVNITEVKICLGEFITIHHIGCRSRTQSRDMHVLDWLGYHIREEGSSGTEHWNIENTL